MGPEPGHQMYQVVVLLEDNIFGSNRICSRQVNPLQWLTTVGPKIHIDLQFVVNPVMHRDFSGISISVEYQ